MVLPSTVTITVPETRRHRHTDTHMDTHMYYSRYASFVLCAVLV